MHHKPPKQRRKYLGSLTLPLVWLAVTGFGIYLRPSPDGHGTHQQLGLPPCGSVILFDRPCPGCGLTTSWTATIHGNLAEAFSAHPLGPPLYLIFTVLAVANVWAFAKKRTVDTSGVRWTYGVVAAGIIFFGFGMARFFSTPKYAAPNELGDYFKRVAGVGANRS